MIEDFNTLLISINRSYRQKIKKGMVVSYDTMKELVLRNTYRTFHIKQVEYTLFSIVHEMFSRIDHIQFNSVQLLSSVRLCDPMNCSIPCLPVHQQLPESAKTHVHWVGDATQPYVVLFSSCSQSFPASGSFKMSQLFTSGGQSIGVSASASVLPMNTQDWSPLDGLVDSPCRPRDSQESSPIPQFKINIKISAQLSL